MSRSKIVLSLAARRELTAVRVAASNRRSKYAKSFDRVTCTLLETRHTYGPELSRIRTTTLVNLFADWRSQAVAKQTAKVAKSKAPMAHRLFLSRDDLGTTAHCQCGEQLQARPTSESYAKGRATRHANAVLALSA